VGLDPVFWIRMVFSAVVEVYFRCRGVFRLYPRRDTLGLARVGRSEGALHRSYGYDARSSVIGPAYVELLPDETQATARRFLRSALRWFRAHCVHVRRMLTDNGSAIGPGGVPLANVASEDADATHAGPPPAARFKGTVRTSSVWTKNGTEVSKKATRHGTPGLLSSHPRSATLRCPSWSSASAPCPSCANPNVAYSAHGGAAQARNSGRKP
jgi:hypothetical protein